MHTTCCRARSRTRCGTTCWCATSLASRSRPPDARPRSRFHRRSDQAAAGQARGQRALRAGGRGPVLRRAPSRAAGPRWRNVDLDGAKLHVVEALEETRSGLTVKTPKTAAGRRTISLPAIVVDALRAHRRAQLEMRLALGLGKPSDDALVFPGIDGRHQSPRAFSMAWRRATRRLGLPAVHWHALRHTHASMLIAAGVDVVTVSRRLGHSKPDVTLRVYSHLFAADDSAAAAAIDRALG